MKTYQSERFFLLSPDVLGALDTQGNLVRVNPAWEQCFGWVTSELVSKSYLDFIHPNDRLKTLENLNKLRDTSSALSWENQMTLKIGGYLDFSWMGVVDPENNYIYISGRDLLAQSMNSLYQTRQQNEKELSRVLDNLPILIAHWNRDLRNTNANQAYADYFGKTPMQIKGLHIRDVIGPVFYKAHFKHIEAALRGEPQTFERSVAGPHGNTRHAVIYYFPDILNGELNGFFVIVTDITKVKELENERRKMEAQLSFASKRSMVGDMAGGIAHEINTPLCAIAMLIDRLIEGLRNNSSDKEKLLYYIKNIGGACFKISEIIKALQTVARDGSKDPFELVPLSIILKNALTLSAQHLKYKGVQIKISSTSDELMVFAQKAQIIQVLLNLLNNSYDAIANQKEPWIEIKTSVHDKDICVSIIDSGIGIPKNIQDKIMQPFFTTKEVGRGAGLGLSTALGIMQHHGGTLRIDKEHPNTCFTIWLPKVRM